MRIGGVIIVILRFEKGFRLSLSPGHMEMLAKHPFAPWAGWFTMSRHPVTPCHSLSPKWEVSGVPMLIQSDSQDFSHLLLRSRFFLDKPMFTFQIIWENLRAWCEWDGFSLRITSSKIIDISSSWEI